MHKKRASLPEIDDLLSARKPGRLKKSDVRNARLPPVRQRNPESGGQELRNCMIAINSLISEHDRLLDDYPTPKKRRGPLILPPRHALEAVDFGRSRFRQDHSAGEMERLKINLNQHRCQML